ncbi:hypothetical protein ACKWTF_009494 [Chironomus riparius]
MRNLLLATVCALMLALVFGKTTCNNNESDMCSKCYCNANEERICSKSIVCMLNNHALSRGIRDVESKSDTNRIHNEATNVLGFMIEDCTPLETKFKSCNFCKCARNGKGWFCTQKECIPKH